MSTRYRALALSLLLVVVTGCATTGAADKRIRELEQLQVRAAIARDRATLDQLFAPDFRIVNPAGAVANKEELFKLLVDGAASPYRSAVYETESVKVYGKVAVSRGLETVVPNQGAQAGQTVQRRITHVWEKQGKDWRLALRHATNVVR
jgi:uncharacterized protein (TIGR02246 family)